MSASTVPLDRTDLLRAAQDVHSAAVLPESAPQIRPHLRPVPAPQAKRKSPLAGALTAVAIVLSILFAQLGLSIAVSQGAYEARALQAELRDLTRVERVLSQNAEKLASPQNLAENAVRLGMVQNTTPATLRLSDGAVLGTIAGGTAAVTANSVPNSTLAGIPVVNADGLLTVRDSEKAALAADAKQSTPVAWEGLLPAPNTH